MVVHTDRIFFFCTELLLNTLTAKVEQVHAVTRKNTYVVSNTLIQIECLRFECI